MEVVVTTGAVRRAKLQSNHHHQQTNTQLLTGQMPFLSPNQQCQRTEGKQHLIWVWWNICIFQVGKKIPSTLTQYSMKADLLGRGDLQTFCQCLLKVRYRHSSVWRPDATAWGRHASLDVSGMLAGVRALAWTLPARPDRDACAELASLSFHLFLLSFEARGRIDSVLVDKSCRVSCNIVAVS